MASISAPDQPLKVVVIGGSLAGLMAGIVLRRLGHDVQVLEQTESSDREEQGAGITVGPAAIEFFSTYDLIPKPYFVPCPGIQFLNAESQVKRFLKRPMHMSSWTTLYHRLRANFDGFQSPFCPESPVMPAQYGEASIKFGAKVTKVSYDNSKVTVDYIDASQGVAKSIEAGLVIAADGASSTLRQVLLPGFQRKYAGYLAWRGYVDEIDMSLERRDILTPECSGFSYSGGYILCYVVPGNNGSLEVGQRRFNWVWYSKCDQESKRFADIMTDVDGKQHRNSIPKGKMRKEIWETQRKAGNEILNSVFVELINKTAEPFLSVIQDYSAPQAAFFEGKLLLIGDALATFRPHLAMSINQAGLNCLLLAKVLRGEITLKAWEKEVVRYGHRTRLASTAFGNFFLYGGMIFVRSVLAWVISLLPFTLRWYKARL